MFYTDNKAFNQHIINYFMLTKHFHSQIAKVYVRINENKQKTVISDTQKFG